MIKIAVVINYITNNGPSRVVLDIIHNLNYEQYAVALITLFDGNDPRIVRDLKKQKVAVYECKTMSRLKCVLGYDTAFQNLIQKEQFDIVHTHGFIPDLLASRIKTKAKTISTIHNNMFEDYVNQYGPLKSWLFTKIHLKALQLIDRKICCSASVYIVMKNKLKDIAYIQNGIECPKAKKQITRTQLAIPNDARVFIFAGGLIPRKNVGFLIREFVKSHLANEYLIIIGDGIEKAECSALADDHVKLFGFQADPISYFNISDFYISASKSEGFSIAVLEALFCGLGLFLSDIPSHREVIEMKQNLKLGVLFQENSFASSLDSVRKMDFSKRNIRNFALKELTAVRMTSEYDKVYRKLLID